MYNTRSWVNYLLITGFSLILFTSSAYGKSIVLRLGHVNAHGSPIDKGISLFSELVKDKSGSKYTVTAYGASQLGNPMQLLSMVKKGVVDIAVIPTALLETDVEQIKVLNLPFLFQSYDEADKFFVGEAGDSILALLSNANLIGLSFYEDGMVGIASKRGAVLKVADYRGLKIRSTQIDSSSINILGATPVLLPGAKVFQALNQGLIDSTLVTTFRFVQANYKEKLNYYSLTNQYYASQVLIINKIKFNKMSEKTRLIISDSAVVSSYYQKLLSRKLERQSLWALKRESVEIFRNPDILAMKEEFKRIYEQYKKLWGKIDCSECPLPPWCCD